MEIRQLIDNDEQPFVPVTHTKAVTDENGKSLDTILKDLANGSGGGGTISGDGLKEITINGNSFTELDNYKSHDKCGVYKLSSKFGIIGTLFISTDNSRHIIDQVLISNLIPVNGKLDGSHKDGSVSVLYRVYNLNRTNPDSTTPELNTWSVWSNIYSDKYATKTDLSNYTTEVKHNLDTLKLTNELKTKQDQLTSNSILGKVNGLDFKFGSDIYPTGTKAVVSGKIASYPMSGVAIGVSPADPSLSDGTGSVCLRPEGIATVCEGFGTYAIGWISHAEGDNCKCNSERSHSGGKDCETYGGTSLSFGQGAITDSYGQIAIGRYNKYTKPGQINNSDASHKPGSTIFVVGVGATNAKRENAFRITQDGKSYFKTFASFSGADYAEMFEWTDGNLEGEDRVGYFVTLDGEKIRKANSKDTYVLGIVSATPAILGNNPEEWHGRFKTDEWGRELFEEKSYEYDTLVERDGNIDKEKKIYSHQEKIEEDNYNSSAYVLRSERPEWSAVGLYGKLLIRQDGTLSVGCMCKPNDNGIATLDNSGGGYYVMKIINNNQALIMLK